MRLESCFPPFLRRVEVVVRVRLRGWVVGGWRRYGERKVFDGRGRGRVCGSVVVSVVGSLARIADCSCG